MNILLCITINIAPNSSILYENIRKYNTILFYYPDFSHIISRFFNSQFFKTFFQQLPPIILHNIFQNDISNFYTSVSIILMEFIGLYIK